MIATLVSPTIAGDGVTERWTYEYLPESRMGDFARLEHVLGAGIRRDGCRNLSGCIASFERRKAQRRYPPLRCLSKHLGR
jgi:hypothetical protein